MIALIAATALIVLAVATLIGLTVAAAVAGWFMASRAVAGESIEAFIVVEDA